MKKLFYFIIPLSVLFYSCDEENETGGGSLSSEDASAEMNSLASKAGDDITAMIESDGANAALDLIELIDTYEFSATSGRKESVKAQISDFFQKFVIDPSRRTTEDEVTSLDDIKGLYVWNPTTETFDEFESDFFIIQFPTEGSTENNAEFRISALELDENGGEYLPVKIESYLKVGTEEVISLSLDVTWTTDAFPSVANIQLDINPFSYTLGFDNLGATSSSLLSTLKLNGEEILGIDVDVEFATQLKKDPTLIEGYVLYYNLRVLGSLAIPTEDDQLDPDYNVNDFVSLEVQLDDEKVGDVIFVGEDEVAYIQYLDGTTEELEALFESAISDLEDALDDFE